MTLKTILTTAERFIVNNSTGILTGLGVAGTVTTAVLVGKATYSSALIIESQRDPDHPHEFSTKEVVRQVWKEYIPAALVLSATITSIVMANQIGSRRAAAIAAAFKLSEKMTEEYRQKVIATLGGKNEEKMRSELAAEKMARTPGHEAIIISGTNVLFFDELSGRYFKSDMESVRKAVNEINYQVNNYYCASLSEFYDKIGLENTAFSDQLGWNSDDLLEVTFSATLVNEREAAVAISYNKTPIVGYDRCS